MFYWDDEILGNKPSLERLGSLNGRKTALKPGLVDGWLVLYLDNHKVCPLQTLAYNAAEQGYSNLDDYLLDKLDSPELAPYLKFEEVRSAVKGVIDYLRESERQLYQANDKLVEEGNEQYDATLELRLMLQNTYATLQFAEMQIESYRQAYNRIVDEVNGENEDIQPTNRVNKFGELDDFGDWIYLDPPHKVGWIQ